MSMVNLRISLAALFAIVAVGCQDLRTICKNTGPIPSIDTSLEAVERNTEKIGVVDASVKALEAPLGALQSQVGATNSKLEALLSRIQLLSGAGGLVALVLVATIFIIASPLTRPDGRSRTVAAAPGRCEDRYMHKRLGVGACILALGGPIAWLAALWLRPDLGASAPTSWMGLNIVICSLPSVVAVVLSVLGSQTRRRGGEVA